MNKYKYTYIDSLFLLFGPVGLIYSLVLLFYPHFDDEMPRTKDELTPVSGVVTDFYISGHKGGENYFIKVRVGDDEETLQVYKCCLEWLKGKRVEALTYPDFLGRWFDNAWELRVVSGNQIYTYEDRRRSYLAGMPFRENLAMCALFLGVITTPFWYVRRKKRQRAQ